MQLNVTMKWLDYDDVWLIFDIDSYFSDEEIAYDLKSYFSDGDEIYMVKYFIMENRPILLAFFLYSNATVGGRRAELNRTLPRVRKCLIFENECPYHKVPFP